jgi:hypothetical protein
VVAIITTVLVWAALLISEELHPQDTQMVVTSHITIKHILLREQAGQAAISTVIEDQMVGQEL